MSITGAIVLFATTWFLVFFIVLPLRFQSQQDAGEIVPGTPKSAPSGHVVGRKAKITTVVTLVIWGALVAVIMSGVISIRNVDVFQILTPRAP
ncbi:MAG TPA: DUF1467 family protein [Tabrizicola sp.]